jgi:hypothetical protein
VCYSDQPGDHHTVARTNVITITAPGVGRSEVLLAICEEYAWALAVNGHSLFAEDDKLVVLAKESLRPKPFVDFVLGIAEGLAQTSA